VKDFCNENLKNDKILKNTPEDGKLSNVYGLAESILRK
jgi:hypothetical protein